MNERKEPVLIELGDDRAGKKRRGPEATIGPDSAPPVPEIGPERAPNGRAMQAVVRFGGRRRSRLARWFWGLLGTLFSFALSIIAPPVL